MPTINTEVEFEVKCKGCNNELFVIVETRSGFPVVVVSPCHNCKSDARSEGYDSGMKDGTAH